MSEKNDTTPPLPAQVPRKRRPFEQLLDVHIAMWLAGDDITPSERRRLEDLKAQRKRERAVDGQVVGVLLPEEGVTPEQRAAVIEQVTKLNPTAIHHHGVSSPIHQACRRLAPVEVHRGFDYQGHMEVVRHPDVEVIVAAAKETTVQPYALDGVWHAVGLARHRRMPTTVVFPNGQVQEDTRTND